MSFFGGKKRLRRVYPSPTCAAIDALMSMLVKKGICTDDEIRQLFCDYYQLHEEHAYMEQRGMSPRKRGLDWDPIADPPLTKEQIEAL